MRYEALVWNVQRFFDRQRPRIARALGASDEEWSEEQYQRKLHNVAHCLRGAFGDAPPALIALTEVESETIANDLIAATGWSALRSVDMGSAPKELEGLDVVLLHNTDLFENRPATVRSIALDNRLATRDLLHAQLRLRDGPGVLHVIVVHWPSRVISEGAVLRMAHGFYLQRLLDQVLKFSQAELTRSNGSIELPRPEQLLARWNTPCFIVGDFNDEPYDPSIREALRSTRDLDGIRSEGHLSSGLVSRPGEYLGNKVRLLNPCWNLSFHDGGESGGTYYRDGEWRTYDQVMLTHGALQPDARVRYIPDTVEIVRLEDFEDEGKQIRMATRSGLPRRFSREDPTGVSDHFPLKFSIEIA